jgi:hypothetical protein
MRQAKEQDELRKRFMEAQIEGLNRPVRREPKIIAGPDGRPIYSTDYEGKSPYLEPKPHDYAEGMYGEYERDVPAERRRELPYMKWLQQRTRATNASTSSKGPNWALEEQVLPDGRIQKVWVDKNDPNKQGPAFGSAHTPSGDDAFNFRAADASVFDRSAGQAFGGVYDPLTGQFSGLDKETAAKASRLSADAARLWREGQGSISHNEAFARALSSQRKPAPAPKGARGAAPPAAIEHLRRNPQLKGDFQRKYGYLPQGM